jgi:hypothetical protein
MQFSTNLFSQIIHIIPRVSFTQLVQESGAERHAKGFSSWDQYVAMLFCQLAQTKSLREISDGLAVTCGKLSHLGLSAAPPQEYSGLCQCPPSLSVVSERLFPATGFVSPGKPR